jgi:hypothetical protein
MFHLALLSAFLPTGQLMNTTNTTDIALYINSDLNVIDFLSKINEGQRIIYDMCELLDETYSIISGTNKPSCEYNVSYIDNDIIYVYPIKAKIRQFLQDEKKNFCKQQKIECGELTIIIKLLDIIKFATDLSFKTNNSISLNTNLKIINFDEMFNLYKNSLSNVNILTNITLSKQKANIILEQEKKRLRYEHDKTWLGGFTDQVAIYVGEPVSNGLIFIGTNVGNIFSSTVESALPNMSIEYKAIIILILIILVKR